VADSLWDGGYGFDGANEFCGLYTDVEIGRGANCRPCGDAKFLDGRSAESGSSFLPRLTPRSEGLGFA
jgi:hypothetical protein